MTDVSLNVICCVKGEERYVVLYDSHRAKDAALQLLLWGIDRNLSLTLDDADVLCEKIRVDTTSPTD